jgi:hypothetical protein
LYIQLFNCKERSKYLLLTKAFTDCDLPFFKAFGNACEDKEDAAFHITKISASLKKKQVIELISSLCEEEIEETTSFANLFRSNSLATKTLDMLMKHIAIDYVIDSIQNALAVILKENKDCEIDPDHFQNDSDKNCIEKRYTLLRGNFLLQ